MSKKTINKTVQKRLIECSCPIHNIGMVQVFEDKNIVQNSQRYLAECPRKDCDIQGTTEVMHGPVTLLPKFQELLYSS